MDFMLWAVRGMHLFAVALWLGGVLYQSVAVIPGLKSDTSAEPGLNHVILFIPFLWMSLTTVLVTGLLLTLFNPRFVFGEYADWWSLALGLKQVSFVLMAVLTFGLARVSRILHNAGPDDSPLRKLALKRLGLFNKQIVFLGITALLLAASMQD